MSTTVQSAIDMVRSVHPAFSRFMVPDKALADYFTREQQRLMTLALMRDRSYLAQSMPILFDLANADLDAPGTAGSGTTGGVPAESDGAGGFRAVQATTGSALTVTEGTIFVSDNAVVSATATTLVAFGVAWTVNAWIGYDVIIVAGTGAGTSPRTIVSNTATAPTVASAWEVTPDATSVFRIVLGTSTVNTSVAVVTDLPSLVTSRGYLVKLDAHGTPYLDVTAPLVAHVARGIPLPPFHTIVASGCTVRYSGELAQSDYAGVPLNIVAEVSRYTGRQRPAAYLRGQSLFLCGNRTDWQDVESIELTYVPVPPAFTARTDYFLLPDTAIPTIAARGAVFAASRIAGLPGVPQAPSDLLLKEASEAEATYLQSISLTKRARQGRVRPGFA